MDDSVNPQLNLLPRTPFYQQPLYLIPSQPSNRLANQFLFPILRVSWMCNNKIPPLSLMFPVFPFLLHRIFLLYVLLMLLLLWFLYFLFFLNRIGHNTNYVAERPTDTKYHKFIYIFNFLDLVEQTVWAGSSNYHLAFKLISKIFHMLRI